MPAQYHCFRPLYSQASAAAAADGRMSTDTSVDAVASGQCLVALTDVFVNLDERVLFDVT